MSDEYENALQQAIRERDEARAIYARDIGLPQAYLLAAQHELECLKATMNDRDEIPDYAERGRRMGDLIAAPALPIADIALFLDVPLSTMDKLRAEGRGPRCFKIGRRLYCSQADLRAWIDHLAKTAEVGLLK